VKTESQDSLAEVEVVATAREVLAEVVALADVVVRADSAARPAVPVLPSFRSRAR
jgi:hypothetical protein